MKIKILVFLLLVVLPVVVSAKDITSNVKIKIDDKKTSKLVDKKENTYINVDKDEVINIKSKEDICYIYIVYELKSINGIIKSDSDELIIGVNNFLHEYIDISKFNNKKEFTIKYDEDVKIGEIYIFSEGELPEFVEIWNKPYEKCDLLLFSTHSDDEQLFFAGLIPHYIANKKKVQIVYFTNHFDNPKRLHEQIHGLYKVGVRNYPIIGFIPDAWSKTLEEATKNLNEAGYSYDDAVQFEVEMIRRFKPSVIVGHDELGEYSHGQHILNTDVLKKAIISANNKEYDNKSFEKYGIWDTPKTYLHLYKDNKITMNYDEPLEFFYGKTAYEMSKIGFNEHKSQQFTWFTKWLTGIDEKGKGTPYTKITEIDTYSPTDYGLYRSTIGEDTLKNDMFENVLELVEEKNPIKKIIYKIKRRDYSKVKYYVAIIITGIISLIIIYNKYYKKKEIQ